MPMKSVTREQMKHIPYVDLPVTKSTPPGFAVESVHFSICYIFAQTTNEQQTFFGTEELGCFGPVDDEELRNDGEDKGSKAFDDENPAPAIVPPESSHIRQGVREKLQRGSGMAGGW